MKINILSETDEVVEVNIMGVFVSQAVGSREEARKKAEEAAFFKLERNHSISIRL